MSLLAVNFISNEREQEAQLEITKKRNLHLNGFAQESPRRMLGVFPAVAFTPATLSLAQGGPGERRRFLDVALSMLTPAYAVRLSKYLKALAQRNALLRQAEPSLELLETWDQSLAHHAAYITNARLRYLDQLIPAAADFYTGVSAGRETLGIEIQLTGLSPGLLPPEGAPAAAGEEGSRSDVTPDTYLLAYEKARPNDLRRQMTTVGPHRDDLLMSLNGRSLRDYGSQGQQRTAALSLKLAEAAVLREVTDECPVALLDDVLSELDARRQADLLRYLEGWQVFLTCCEPGHALHGSAGKVFRVKDGMMS